MPVASLKAVAEPARLRVAALLHAGVVFSVFTVLFSWVFASLLFSDVYLSESDLYDWFLPDFLSPIATWSSHTFAGLPVFADTSDATPYPVYFFFAHIVGSWAGYVIAAYVLGACFAYAYAYVITRSRSAAWFTGVAYGLSEAMLGRQAHINFVHAFAWLPLMVLAVDRILVSASWRWMAVGACATSCCLLSGHPQPALYAVSFCSVYALAGGLSQRVPPAAYIRIGVMFAVGALLMSIKAVPFIEAAEYIGRQQVSLDQFVSHANTPAQMMSLLFPSVAHDRREASLYVGFVAMMLAVIAAVRAGRDWRVAVWVGAAVTVGLIAMGNSTPVPALLHMLPIYGRSRVITRMMFIFAFAMAALAGLGMAAIQRRQLSGRAIVVTVGAMLIGLVLGASWLATNPSGIEFEFDTRSLPVWNAGVWIQFGIAMLTAGLTWWLITAGPRRFQVGAVALIVLLAVDLLHGQPYGITPRGLQLITMSASDTQPSVHARWMAAQLAPLHQRFLAISGTTRDAIVPGAFARLWRIPIAGGYSPILLGRLTALATTGNNGDVQTETLAFDDAALDLLAVRYIAVREDDFPPQPTFERNGVTWSAPALDIPVGSGNCRYRHPTSKSFQLPADQTASAIEFVVDMRCAEDVMQGTEVGDIEIASGGGEPKRQLLFAGINIGDRGLSDDAVLRRAKHQPASGRFDDPELNPDVYAMRVDVEPVARDLLVTIHGAPTGGWLVVDRVTLKDADGGYRPQTLQGLYLGDHRRWREVKRIRTSRSSDRDSDEDRDDELEYTVYENLRALPRAWIASEVLPMEERDMITAIHTSQLPDGRTLDPRRVALVDADATPVMHFEPGDSSAAVTAIEDGRIAVDVTTTAGGFLVLSESHFPGWYARIGNDVVPTRRTDLDLQGVVVPPGHHQVVFELASVSRRIGISLSVIGLVCVAFLLVAPHRAATTKT